MKENIILKECPKNPHFWRSDYSTLSTPFYNKIGSFDHILSQHSPEVFSKLSIKAHLSEWTHYSTANSTAKLTFVRGSLFSMFINKIMKSYNLEAKI